jgi:CO/xanthine dehydrogenase Mo-binding subunit/aerobic-type carbon monoxide dehydrogenase small subunit (CoxS/CutS family)
MQLGATRTINFIVNGNQVTLSVPEKRSLVAILREDLGLTGAKIGCGIGVCGTCTVIMNGKAVRSCVIPAEQVDGKEIITIEGLGTKNNLHPIQQAFIRHHAVQCGYCTSGMILTATAFLDTNLNPSRRQIQQALTGNLCRCTGYQQIIDAVLDAAKQIRNPKLAPIKSGSEIRNTYVGESVPRVDILDKVTGQAKYTADIKIAHMLVAKILRSPYSHARILNINSSKAKQVDGVVAVLTASDIPGSKLYGKALPDQPALAVDLVRYFGEPVVVVVAESEEIANLALDKIIVGYEPLPTVFNPIEAMKSAAPKLHEEDIYRSLSPHSDEVHTKNILYHFPIRKGDIDSGFAQAAQIIERTYTTPWVEHACLETEAAIAYYDETGKLTVTAPSHNIYFDRREIARVLGLDKDQIRFIKPPMGASFGKREDIYGQILVALATYHTQRPVKLLFTREETFAVTTKRHPMLMRYKTGVTKEGKIIAVEAEIIADTGAYASWAPNILRKSAVHAAGPYNIPNIKIDAYAIYTNNVPAGAMRGFGATQVAFAYESQIDAVAKEIGMDPFEFRRKNLLINGSRTATGQVLKSAIEPVATIEAVLSASQKITNHKSQITNHKSKKYGWGIATIFYGIGYGYGIPDIGTAIIELSSEGKALIATSAIDYGQGLATIFCQIAADILGMDLADVHIITGDTELTPDSGSTVATRQTYITGNAVKLAAEKLREEMIDFVSTIFKVPSGKVVIKNSNVAVENFQPQPISKVIQQMHAVGKPTKKQARFKPETQRLDPQTGQGDAYYPYTFGTQLAEVEVDTNTGEVKVLQIIAAHNVGKAIHPENVLGQIYGGIAMGLGMALTERFEINEGLPLTTNFHEYRIPKTTDMPEIIPIVLESAELTGPFGALGIGEPAMIPTAPAIVNAIANATGIRIYDLPAIPPKINFALVSRNK